MLPERIVADGWTAFERTDIVLLACGLAAGFAALLGRLDVAGLAGGAAGLIVAGARMRERGGSAAAPVDWSASPVVPSAAMAGEKQGSVAPPS